MDLFADDVAKTIDALGADRVDLAGLSLGGYVLFSFWRRHREKVRSLALVDTKAEADSEEAKEGREKTAAIVTEKGTAELVDGLFPKIFASETPDTAKNKVREMFENTPGPTAAADALAMRDRADSTGELPGITVPVLVVQGEEDALMPVEGAKAMAEKIPSAKFVSIPKAGHMAPLENPEEVNRALREFLTAQPV
jgi:pimeloyl-ACP methyl ester carboxylesterase